MSELAYNRFSPEPKGICGKCKHLHLTGKRGCDAYPDGIPFEILLGEFDHHSRFFFEDDHGITFEPKEASSD